MCLTSQNLDWFKSYDTKCTLRLHAILAKLEIDHQKLLLINVLFTTISGHFCANFMKIFDKTQIQTAILSLNHDWYNRYDTKWKKTTKKTSYTFLNSTIGFSNPLKDEFLHSRLFCFSQLWKLQLQSFSGFASVFFRSEVMLPHIQIFYRFG